MTCIDINTHTTREQLLYDVHRYRHRQIQTHTHTHTHTHIHTHEIDVVFSASFSKKLQTIFT
jgi:hypothetical protein